MEHPGRSRVRSWLQEGWARWTDGNPSIAHLIFAEGKPKQCGSSSNVRTLLIEKGRNGEVATTVLPAAGRPMMILDDNAIAATRPDPPGVAAHEIGHAWGLLHEHQRPDFWEANEYSSATGSANAVLYDCSAVRGYQDVVQAAAEDGHDESWVQNDPSAFAHAAKATTWCDDHGSVISTSIDFASIMLYSGTDGARDLPNGQKAIVMAYHDTGEALRQNSRASPNDVAAFALMYPCQGGRASRKRQDGAPACGAPRSVTALPPVASPLNPGEIISEPRLQASTSASTPASSSPTAGAGPLQSTAVAPGQAVKRGTELRILTVGDSITVGFRSDTNGGNGNGYREQLLRDLSADNVVFAGNQSPEDGDGSIRATTDTISDDYYAAWSGQTIQFIANHVGPSLDQRPNIILLMAGTNDMNPNPSISKQGNDPSGAAQRLGSLIDQMISTCPDATILVAQILNTCDQSQEPRTQQYNALIPGVVQSRAAAGNHVLTVDFTTFPTSMLHQDDCIHPTNQGYSTMGDYWYSFVHQIPQGWIQSPIGSDPTHANTTLAGVDVDASANGGPDPNIPAPSFPPSIVQPAGKAAVYAAASSAGKGGAASCNGGPVWDGTGQIALGIGQNGDWQYSKNWVQAGRLAEGIHLGSHPIHMADINADGKADYLYVNPDSGQLVAWLNNLPDAWSPAGSSGGVIADGAGTGETVFFADMNGDGYADYLVVDENTGSVTCYWNHGADASAEHGWRFVPGGVIASGVPHANLATLRFPDINGDGRADYVIIGEGGSLGLWINSGQPGSQDVLFVAQGGIASGASPDISNVVFADINGDGRDDYLVWDDIGGLSGYLNQPTEKAGLPFYIAQGGGEAKVVADGISQDPSLLRLADLDGDGKDDYIYVDTENGALWVLWNRGEADSSMAEDGLRFADIDGDGLDDFIWLDPNSGAPVVYLNGGPSSDDQLGWSFVPLNGGGPLALGAAPADQVQFGDIDGDGMADYLVIDPVSGALSVWLNAGARDSAIDGWQWNPIGQIATGLGPGGRDNVRFADIDGDGLVDYIYLHDNGGTTIYRNQYSPDTPDTDFAALPDADAAGISQRPADISFHDIDGDGLADYLFTDPLDGSVSVWLNNYPAQPTWLPQGKLKSGEGESGALIRWSVLQSTGRASYVAVNPNNNAISAWLNECDDRGPAPGPVGNRNPCVEVQGTIGYLILEDQFFITVTEGASKTCDGVSHSKVGASDDTVWSVDCADGISVRGRYSDALWNYTNTNNNIDRSIKVHNKAGRPYVCDTNGRNVDLYCSDKNFGNNGVCDLSPLPSSLPEPAES